MKRFFVLLALAASPAFAQIQSALHLDNFDETFWFDGKDELAFFKQTRYFSSQSQTPDIKYRYRILRQDRSIEAGTCSLSFAWREELPYLKDNAPATNYYYHLTLIPDRGARGSSPQAAGSVLGAKSAASRRITLRMIFLGGGILPLGFMDTATDTLWQNRLSSGFSRSPDLDRAVFLGYNIL